MALSFSGTSNFINNSASNESRGGAIYVKYYTEVSFSGTNNFTTTQQVLAVATLCPFSLFCVLALLGVQREVSAATAREMQ